MHAAFFGFEAYARPGKLMPAKALFFGGLIFLLYRRYFLSFFGKCCSLIRQKAGGSAPILDMGAESMRVYGEAFLLMNGWMNCLALALAFRLGRRRISPLRCLGAAGIGAVYGVLALWMDGPLRGLPGLAGCAVLMGALAGGGRGAGLWPLIFAVGWMLGGMTDGLLILGLPPLWALAGSSLGAVGLGRYLGRALPEGRGTYRLVIEWQGRMYRLQAIRDSGNLLRDPVTGLPVIVAPAGALPGLIPAGMQALPRGFRLLSLRTATGKGLVPCMHPEALWLLRNGRKWQTDAIVAIGGFDERWALLPEAMFMEEGRMDAAF